MTDLTLHAEFATKACEFLTNSPDPFHAVANCVAKLDAAGFVALRKRDPFAGKLEPGGKYYYTINHSTLVAFTVGGKYLAGNGFVVLGGHTDSPNLKVKPRSQKSQHGCLQLGVECYGGGLWHTV
ncbi:peptidase [Fragilaria crotonensis]|nr:peptidase [Fragilaria crotonensis]